MNLIESLIEGQFFKEAIEELSSLQAHYIPPVCLLHALLENILQVRALLRVYNLSKYVKNEHFPICKFLAYFLFSVFFPLILIGNAVAMYYLSYF